MALDHVNRLVRIRPDVLAEKPPSDGFPPALDELRQILLNRLPLTPRDDDPVVLPVGWAGILDAVDRDISMLTTYELRELGQREHDGSLRFVFHLPADTEDRIRAEVGRVTDVAIALAAITCDRCGNEDATVTLNQGPSGARAPRCAKHQGNPEIDATRPIEPIL